jgi:hypothetical protein
MDVLLYGPRPIGGRRGESFQIARLAPPVPVRRDCIACFALSSLAMQLLGYLLH